MNRTKLIFGSLVVALILLLLLNILVDTTLTGARLDLTEGNLYTLSEGSKKIVRGLDEPITARLYFSDGLAAGLPELVSYAQRVRELLEEYESVSGGNLRLELVDPEPFSEAEDEAVAAGLRGAMGPTREMIYFGLVISNSVDERELIPWFDMQRENLLEYDVSSLIHRVGSSEQPVVAIMSGLPIDGGPPAMFPGAPPPAPAWYIVDQAREFFDVRFVLPSAPEIPAETAVLMVVHPKEFPDEALYAIDQYVLGGGHALVFVDPYCEVDQPPQDPNNPMAAMMASRLSDLGPLFAAWGIEMVPDRVLGDRQFALQIRAGTPDRPEVVHYVLWLALQEGQFDTADAVTSQITRINLGTAGILRPLAGAATTTVPLIVSSDDAAEIEATKVQFMPDPKAMLREYVPTGEALAVAMRVRGPAETAFPGGLGGSDDDPDADASEDEAEAGEQAGGHIERSERPINVIVAADVDMLTDRFWVQFQNFLGMRMVQQSANNGDFVINALENLSGSDDLISVRSRAGFSRPFVYMDELERQAEERFLEEEQKLQQKLSDTEQQINDLETQKGDGAASPGQVFLSPEQREAIDLFQAERIKIRKQLRNVQYALNKDIERLKAQLKLANIGLVPLLVLIAAVAQWSFRNRRRREG